MTIKTAEQVKTLGNVTMEGSLTLSVPVEVEANYELNLVDEKAFTESLSKEELEAFQAKDTEEYKAFIHKLLSEAERKVIAHGERFECWTESEEVMPGLFVETIEPSHLQSAAIESADIWDAELDSVNDLWGSTYVCAVETANE